MAQQGQYAAATTGNAANTLATKTTLVVANFASLWWVVGGYFVLTNYIVTWTVSRVGKAHSGKYYLAIMCLTGSDRF